MVKQEAKDLGIDFHARVQLDMYDDLFARRAQGEKLLINKAMEAHFLECAETPIEKRIEKNILKWREDQIEASQADLEKQKTRLVTANKSLKAKPTKKAENDIRVATNKIDQLEFKLKKLSTSKILSEDEKSIFPFSYVSMITADDDGALIIAPYRYHLRTSGQPESFDRKYFGCYNARRDNLTNNFWKPLFGKRHGIMIVHRFYEHVAADDYAKHFSLPKAQQDKKSVMLEFIPEGLNHMIVPTLWDINKQKGQPDLYSCAIITDEPPAEVAATGHNRCPIFLKSEHVERWLNPSTRSLDELYAILADKQTPTYKHKLVSAA